jgi:hypothetical protein
MANLRQKVEHLGQHFCCPIHRDEPLVCSRCDVLRLPAEEWQELTLLMEEAGYLDPDRDPFQSVGTCWRCGEGELCCLKCANDREQPPGIDLMSDAAVDRLYELAAKLVLPWL